MGSLLVAVGPILNTFSASSQEKEITNVPLAYFALSTQSRTSQGVD